MCGQDPCLPTNWDNYNLTYLIQDDKQWVYSFPGVGIAAGFVDFIVSISALVAFCSLRNKVRKKIKALQRISLIKSSNHSCINVCAHCFRFVGP